ncbi:MAG: bifunctional hydroxymethylpyrimidine kinase/phosphomethylpyrimidine kinase, partial [Thermoleophilia bacterium]|nr:bifunctional hydroxymethylpyrimidine kinase/phosphomethylpyrimidine kinase [Thermoleophilia bacterium]
HCFRAIKVGLLADADQAARLGAFLAAVCGDRQVPVVVDPILRASDGTPLASPGMYEALCEAVLPWATILTPNLEEAVALLPQSGRQTPEATPSGQDDPEYLARCLTARLDTRVVLKGGHLGDGQLKGGPICDIFCSGETCLTYDRPRHAREIHGTGCTLSALLCVFLALGYEPGEAFLAAEKRMDDLLAHAFRPEPARLRPEPADVQANLADWRPEITGVPPEAPERQGNSGYLYVGPGVRQAELAERARVLTELEKAGERLKTLNPVELVPAVQMNLAFALPAARAPEEVAAFPGRIGVFAGRLCFKDRPAFGASSHTARLVLAAMRRYPQVRSCLTLRCGQDVLAAAQAAGLNTYEVDRTLEPETVKEVEGRSLDHLMTRALSEASALPDAVFDRGDVGKEPILRLLGRDPSDVLDKLARLMKVWRQAEPAVWAQAEPAKIAPPQTPAPQTPPQPLNPAIPKEGELK